MKKRITLVLAGLVAVILVTFGRYYIYVTNTESPYDEVGIGLASFMPAPVRDWGCGKLKANFGASLPPHGCQSATDLQAWR